MTALEETSLATDVQRSHVDFLHKGDRTVEAPEGHRQGRVEYIDT